MWKALEARPLWVICVLGTVLVLALLLADRARPGGRPILKISGVDPISYFSVTHSLLFDRDLDLRNQYDRMIAVRGHGSGWFATVPETGRPGSPFAIGYSLLALPFLALGHAGDVLTGGPADGYSGLALACFFLANVFYTALGLALLFLFYRDAGGARPGVALGVALALWPATTLAYYSFSPMSHATSFFATSLFLWSFWRARDCESVSRWLGFGAAAGLMFLVRWQDVVFGLVPLAFEVERLRRARPRFPAPVVRARLAFAAAFALAILPQLLEWKTIYGSFLAVPQGPDFFELPPRHVLQVLLSSNHGWFTWTPITLLGVAGLAFGLRQQRLLAGSALLAIAAQVLLIGSLSYNWNGQGGFGMRILTSAVPLTGLGVVFLLAHERALVRRAAALAGLASVLWALAFGAQYRLDLVPKNDWLTASELVLDKVAFSRAWARRDAARAAEAELEEGRPARAREIATAAIESHGASDRLQRLLLEVSRKDGDPEAELAAQEAYERFRSTLLF
jgi:hypothetical protein